MFQFHHYLIKIDQDTGTPKKVFAFHKARTLFEGEFAMRQTAWKYRTANDNQESPVG